MKVGVIGAGNIGATAAQRIAEADLADVVLVDIVPGKARALGLDLSSAASVMRHSRKIIGTEDYRDIAKADIVIMAAGQARAPGQNRADLLLNNAKIVRDTAQRIARYCPGSIIIVITNPVDVMTYLVCQVTGFRKTQIIGMSGVSDCARFNMLVAEELNTASRDVQSVIIGPHSDEMVILPRFSTVSGTPLLQLLPREKIERIMADTRSFGTRIVKLLGAGSAYYGPSAGIYLLADSIINDRKSILCASTYLSGQYGLKDLCIGVPVKIGRQAVEQIIELKLNEKEKDAFLSSTKAIKKLLKKLGV